MKPKYEKDDELEAGEGKDTITLYLDDDSEMECTVVTTLEADGKNYIALLPLEGIEGEEGEVFLYRFHEDRDGNPVLENIENDDEYEAVSDAFDEWLDTQEYDELVEEGEIEDDFQ